MLQKTVQTFVVALLLAGSASHASEIRRVVTTLDADNKAVETAALADDAVKRALEGRAPKKVIVVPNRIVNIVA